MHLEGATFAQIAAQVGWANRGTAHTAVMAEYRARIDEDVKEKRAQALLEADLIRVGLCDVLQSTKSDSVKVRALGKLLDASKHIAKLQGLVDHVWGVAEGPRTKAPRTPNRARSQPGAVRR